MSRLPIPGSDDDVWGQILNDFLEVSHNNDGTLQTDALTQAGAVTQVNGKTATQGSITLTGADLGVSSDLAGLSDVAVSSPVDNQVLTYDSGSSSWKNESSASGVALDTTAGDIQPLGTQAAGAKGMAADAGHVHAMPRLDQVSVPTAAVSLGSQKITNLANGALASDAAAFGQLPTSLPPNGTASGDLAGSYPSPTVAKVNGVGISGTPSIGQSPVATSSNAAIWATVPGTTDWLNVVSQYGADPTGTNDSTTAIQNALNAASTAGGKTVYFPVGQYIISSALIIPNDTALIGGALDAGTTIIKQYSTTANGLTATNATAVKIENLQIYGPSSGTGQGISFGTTGSNINAYITIRNCTIAHFGSDGVYVNTPIVSVFERVISRLNGGHGFNVGGSGASGGTSCAFIACYGNANAQAGYYLNTLQYSNMSGCAADSNGTGYYLNACLAISMNGCGTESNQVNTAPYVGNGFVVYGGAAIGIYSCFVYQNPAISFWITDSADSVELSGCSDSGPTGTATYSIKYDTNTTGSVLDARVTSSTSYVPQINVLNDGSGNATVGGTLSIKGSANNTLQLIDASSYTHSSLQFSPGSAAISFGPGTTATDTTLSRSGVNALQASGSFQAPTLYGSSSSGGDLQLSSTSNATPGQVLIGTQANFDGTSGGVQLGSTTLEFGSGAGVVGLTDAGTVPTTNPSGGGIFYSHDGLPNWRDSSGNVYNLASGGSTVNVPLPDDQNLLAWAYDPIQATVSLAPTLGVLQLVRVILRTQQTVSTIYLDINTAPDGTLTTGQNLVGLYTSSGTLIDSCGDQSSAWATTGFKTASLGSSHTLDAGSYYVGFVANVSGGSPTAPAFARANGLAGVGLMINAGLTASSYRFAVNGSGVTSLSDLTMTSNGEPSCAFWTAIA